MGQRTSFILAAVLTGFLLVALGGVAGRVVGASAANSTPAPTAELVTAMQQREAAYRQLVAEANARLQQMNVASESSANFPITPAQALVIVTSAAGGNPIRMPELVSLQGTVAYEVVLTSGTFYIDATTGRILTNNTPQVAIVARASGGEHEEFEHEGPDND